MGEAYEVGDDTWALEFEYARLQPKLATDLVRMTLLEIIQLINEQAGQVVVHPDDTGGLSLKLIAPSNEFPNTSRFISFSF